MLWRSNDTGQSLAPSRRINPAADGAGRVAESPRRLWAGRTPEKILARHLQYEDVDLTIRSEGGGEQIAAKISFVPSHKKSPERTAITLHEELAITLTWRANCKMVRSRQLTGVLIPVV
jgi:hypothetical protein